VGGRRIEITGQIAGQTGPGRRGHGAQQLGETGGIIGAVKDGTPTSVEGLGIHLLDGGDVALGGQHLQGQLADGDPKAQVIPEGQVGW